MLTAHTDLLFTLTLLLLALLEVGYVPSTTSQLVPLFAIAFIVLDRLRDALFFHYFNIKAVGPRPLVVSCVGVRD
jgi:hypothetical protein